MRAEKLIVEPFDFINFVDINCVKELNRHGVFRAAGLIHREKEQEYMDLAGTETWVSVKAVLEDGEKKNYFEGVMTSLWIKKEGQASVLTIEAKTGSFLLDVKSHTRSFQDTDLLYSQVINACMEPAQGRVIMLDKKEERTGRFLFQYHETDWEFMKRLASYAGTVLIPEDATPGKKAYFGYRKNKISEEVEADSYEAEQDYGEYKRRAASGQEGLRIGDVAGCIVGTRDIYGLGEGVNFKGKSYVVGRVTGGLKGQELYHEYYLTAPRKGILPGFCNHSLAGVSVKAEVTAVERTMVQVRIEGDENSDGGRCRWFDYATVYSTPDGTGWYCMPEVGDTVRLVFPDEDENHAYAAGSIHVGTAGGRTNPEEKSWKNRQDKEVLFTPDSIILRNNKGLSLELSDEEGIKLCSDKDITMQAEGDIRITGQAGGVHMSAKGEILLQQGAAKLHMKDDIKITGGKIYMN